MDVTTLADAVAHFSALGYRGGFRAEEAGLREVLTGNVYAPDHLQIDDLLRFEGESDPDDAAVVFALREVHGDARGTYVVAFGPQMDRLDVAAVRQLRDARSSLRAGGARNPS